MKIILESNSEEAKEIIHIGKDEKDELDTIMLLHNFKERTFNFPNALCPFFKNEEVNDTDETFFDCEFKSANILDNAPLLTHKNITLLSNCAIIDMGTRCINDLLITYKDHGDVEVSVPSSTDLTDVIAEFIKSDHVKDVIKQIEKTTRTYRNVTPIAITGIHNHPFVTSSHNYTFCPGLDKNIKSHYYQDLRIQDKVIVTLALHSYNSTSITYANNQLTSPEFNIKLGKSIKVIYKSKIKRSGLPKLVITLTE
jgi:hypothetical protein